MLYEVGQLGIDHPVTGSALVTGDTFECKPEQLRERWNDPEWIARTGLPFIVRPVTAAPVVAVAQESADPLPVVVPSVSEQSEADGVTEGADAVTYDAETLDALDLDELKTAATGLGLKFGGRVGAAKLRERILAFQAGA